LSGLLHEAIHRREARCLANLPPPRVDDSIAEEICARVVDSSVEQLWPAMHGRRLYHSAVLIGICSPCAAIESGRAERVDAGPVASNFIRNVGSAMAARLEKEFKIDGKAPTFKTPLQGAATSVLPCYQGAAFLFASYGSQLVPIDVDRQGLDVDQLERFSGSLVYLTPSHQFPTGYTMALERRLRLLDWACRTGSYVIEDDYDSDFRYDGPPLTALAGLDRRARVLYLGTFSESIGAGMRLGYIVLPEHLVDQARIVKALLDNGNPWLEQAVLADFLNEGEFLRHLRPYPKPVPFRARRIARIARPVFRVGRSFRSRGGHARDVAPARLSAGCARDAAARPFL
jgi:hypothetical protein